jgi:predicted metal-dependent hydrolase
VDLKLQNIKDLLDCADDKDISELFARKMLWLIQTVEKQQKEVEQYQLQETLLLERIKRDTLQIKEIKAKCRFKFVEKMLEENTKLAKEVARLKGEVLV